MENKDTNRRKTYFVKKDFQTRLIIKAVIMASISAILTTIIILLLYWWKSQGGVYYYTRANIDNPVERQTIGSVLNIVLPGLVVACIISIILTVVLGIFLSHRLAGPLYRLKKHMGFVGDGDLSLNIKFRPKDELKDIADSFNDMLDGLSSRLSNIKNISKEISAYIENNENDKEKLKKLISSLQENLNKLKL